VALMADIGVHRGSRPWLWVGGWIVECYDIKAR